PIKIASFSAVYLAVTFILVPPLAKWQCGRVPLPIWSNPYLRPHNAWFYCFFNRHYVKPELRAAAENAARRLAEKYPGTVVCYLDGCFPFFDGYPLHPHFSHRDGEKLDVALHWLEKSGNPIFGTPMRLGYGAFELPLPGEIDKDEACPNSRFRNLEIQRFGNYNKARFQFDAKRTADMIRFFAEEKAVGKIFLEPHLKTRLGLSRYDKIRFQGCKAARHDDHIHVQM
ncbi:MAG: hypothetical protein AAB316_22065, partial [Bacteroidota bacterium]